MKEEVRKESSVEEEFADSFISELQEDFPVGKCNDAGYNDRYLIHLLTIHGNLEATIAESFQGYPFDFTKVHESSGNTVLHFACHRLSHSTAADFEYLFSQKSVSNLINTPNEWGHTPLHLALYKSMDIVELLIKNGADPLFSQERRFVSAPTPACIALYSENISPAVKAFFDEDTTPQVQAPDPIQRAFINGVWVRLLSTSHSQHGSTSMPELGITHEIKVLKARKQVLRRELINHHPEICVRLNGTAFKEDGEIEEDGEHDMAYWYSPSTLIFNSARFKPLEMDLQFGVCIKTDTQINAWHNGTGLELLTNGGGDLYLTGEELSFKRPEAECIYLKDTKTITGLYYHQLDNTAPSIYQRHDIMTQESCNEGLFRYTADEIIGIYCKIDDPRSAYFAKFLNDRLLAEELIAEPLPYIACYKSSFVFLDSETITRLAGEHDEQEWRRQEEEKLARNPFNKMMMHAVEDRLPDDREHYSDSVTRTTDSSSEDDEDITITVNLSGNLKG